MTPDDIAPEFGPPKDAKLAPIDGVRTLLGFTDTAASFSSLPCEGQSSAELELAEFFQRPVAQVNYSIVDAEGHIRTTTT
jgi:hypothetical protein